VVIVKRGDIFKCGADALVIPVNCVGVMGAGLAKQFKELFPELFGVYREDCKQEEIVLGRVMVFTQVRPVEVMFPTKDHWQDKSQYSDIYNGLLDLRHHVKGILAIPPLGAGLGGLDKSKVLELVKMVFCDKQEVWFIDND